MKKILRPSFVTRFRCLGGDCKDTCCRGWGILADEAEVNLVHSEIAKKKELFPQNPEDLFIPNEAANGSRQYLFRLLENGTCAFLNEEHLCSLQINCGAKALPKICKTFPRACISYLDHLEEYLSLGCERVVQLLIEEKQGIKLIETKVKLDGFSFVRLHQEVDLIKRPILNHYYDIKTMGVYILQNPNYSLEQRQLILGIGMGELDRFEKSGDQGGAKRYIDTYMNQVSTKDFSSIVKSFTGNKMMKIWNSLFLIGFWDDEEMKEIKRQVYENLMVTENLDDEKERQLTFSMRHYQDRKRFFDQFMKERPYLMENIVVNWYLYDQQPFSHQDVGIWDNYLSFTVMVSLYRFLIICLAEEDWKEEIFIKQTVKFSRKLIHNTRLIEAISDYYKQNHAGSLADLAIMLLD